MKISSIVRIYNVNQSFRLTVTSSGNVRIKFEKGASEEECKKVEDFFLSFIEKIPQSIGMTFRGKIQKKYFFSFKDSKDIKFVMWNDSKTINLFSHHTL